MKLSLLSLGLVTWATVAAADVLPGPGPRRPITPVPPQPAANRDPVALARRHPVIAKQLAEARGDAGGAPGRDETAVQVALGGQCGFAGCSQSTLVAFTFRSRGANTATRSVLALVSCPPVGECQVDPAEVKPAQAAAPTTPPVSGKPQQQR